MDYLRLLLLASTALQVTTKSDVGCNIKHLRRPIVRRLAGSGQLRDGDVTAATGTGVFLQIEKNMFETPVFYLGAVKNLGFAQNPSF